MSKRRSNKSVKRMICDSYKYHENINRGINCTVDYAEFNEKGFYVWHYPPCEGGWMEKLGTISLTASELKGE